MINEIDNIEWIAENINNIKAAISKAIVTGGVVQYSLNSGQGSTSVRRATLAELQQQLREMQYLYNEAVENYTGSNINVMRTYNNANRPFSR